MGRKDPRVDEYIREAAPFAIPVLRHIRSMVHRRCPRVEETIKWNVPFFMLDGKILCVMAAFKAHCNFGFWKGRLILNKDKTHARVGMGQLGRITSVKDLPASGKWAGYFKQAITLNEKDGKKGTTPKRRTPGHPKPALRIPPYFSRALRSSRQAMVNFEAFSPSKKRDYVEWIVDAKSEETRERRLETAVDWIAQGKSRQWKYQRG